MQNYFRLILIQFGLLFIAQAGSAKVPACEYLLSRLYVHAHEESPYFFRPLKRSDFKNLQKIFQDEETMKMSGESTRLSRFIRYEVRESRQLVDLNDLGVDWSNFQRAIVDRKTGAFIGVIGI